MTQQLQVWPRTALVAATVVAVAAPAVLGLFFASSPGRGWSEALTAATDSWERGVWRVLRGGIKWIAPPVVIITTAACLVHLLRSGARRPAAIAALLASGSFLTSEAIKHGFLPFPAYGSAGERDLSGHVAMVASATLVALLTVGWHRRRSIAGLCWLLLTGTCLVIITSRWHDIADVVLPLSIMVAWAVAGLTTVRFLVHDAPSSRPDGRRKGLVLPIAVAGLSAIGAALLVVAGSAASVGAPVQTLTATGLAIFAATIAATLIAMLVSDGIDRTVPRPVAAATSPHLSSPEPS